MKKSKTIKKSNKKTWIELLQPGQTITIQDNSKNSDNMIVAEIHSDYFRGTLKLVLVKF